MTWGRIAVATRLGGGWAPAPFFDAWTGLTFAGMRPGDVVLSAVARKPQHLAANMLAAAFVDDSSADTLCLIDNDHTFRPDTLERLRTRPEGHAFDVLGALYLVRNIVPPRPCMFRVDASSPGTDHRTGAVDYTWPSEWPAGDVVEVDACGLGFTLIRRRVLEALPRPWFWFPTETDTTSEDMPFCADARRAGFRLGIDTAVCIGHLLDQSQAHPGPAYEARVIERLGPTRGIPAPRARGADHGTHKRKAAAR